MYAYMYIYMYPYKCYMYMYMYMQTYLPLTTLFESKRGGGQTILKNSHHNSLLLDPPCLARPVLATSGLARPGQTRPCWAWPVLAKPHRPGLARPGQAKPGQASWQGLIFECNCPPGRKLSQQFQYKRRIVPCV